jgi:hypothetical protein
LNLPAGSVRALLGFAVLILLWVGALAFMRGKVTTMPFIYLHMLMFLILGHYFVAHGRNIGDEVSTRSPLGLPRGSVRILLVLGYVGLAVFLYTRQQKVQFDLPPQGDMVLFLGILIGGFFVGWLMTSIFSLGGGDLSPIVQDLQAWIALLAMTGLVVLGIIHLFINPSLNLGERIDPRKLEVALAGLVGFYFGARS